MAPHWEEIIHSLPAAQMTYNLKGSCLASHPLPSVSVAYSPSRCSLFPCCISAEAGLALSKGRESLMFGLGRAEESLLADRLAFVGAHGWQRAVLLPHCKLKGLWCRFGAGPKKSIICLAHLLVSNGSGLNFAENQIQVFC